MVLEELDLEKYKTHPRVLEIRFILLLDIFEREYGYQGAMNYIESLCRAFNGNFVFLSALMNRRFDIKRNGKRKWRLWRQEVIFTSYIYGETIYRVASNYLNVKPHTLYAQSDIYDIKKFCTNEWLENFDNQTILCGQEAYRIEVKRFLEVVENLESVLSKWKGAE